MATLQSDSDSIYSEMPSFLAGVSQMMAGVQQLDYQVSEMALLAISQEQALATAKILNKTRDYGLEDWQRFRASDFRV